MNKIKLLAYAIPDHTSYFTKLNMYGVTLGNGSKEYFSSEKKTKRYLAVLSRYLNLKLHELNHVYALTVQEYRNKWFYLNPNQITNITKKISSTEGAFLKLITLQSRFNYNYYVFQDFGIICKNIIDILQIIETVSRADGTYNETYRAEYLKNRVYRIKDGIFNYGNWRIKEEKSETDPVQ